MLALATEPRVKQEARSVLCHNCQQSGSGTCYTCINITLSKSAIVSAAATTTEVFDNHEAQIPISALPQPSEELETSEPAKVTATSTPSSVTPQCQSHGSEDASSDSQSSASSSPFGLTDCKDVSYEMRGQLHGVSYTESGATGWTPVVGRKKKRRLPEGFLHRLPPDACQRYENQLHFGSDSGSNQDLNDIIPEHAAATYSVVDDVPGLSIQTRNTRQWTPIAARTRAKLKTKQN